MVHVDAVAALHSRSLQNGPVFVVAVFVEQRLVVGFPVLLAHRRFLAAIVADCGYGRKSGLR